MTLIDMIWRRTFIYCFVIFGGFLSFSQEILSLESYNHGEGIRFSEGMIITLE
ncbi:MAG: hypothetical protein CM15mP59_0210 [Flavobacteriaceae bacterium]|nr:MAG: hypothetical protein CM15mP59_0210 [Flavobacteriaceae bacterium]